MAIVRLVRIVTDKALGVKFSDELLQNANCTCPNFLKQYVCKHVLGIAIRLKLFQVCPEAKDIPIGQKRKRGSPAKAKKAFLTQ